MIWSYQCADLCELVFFFLFFFLIFFFFFFFKKKKKTTACKYLSKEKEEKRSTCCDEGRYKLTRLINRRSNKRAAKFDGERRVATFAVGSLERTMATFK